MFKKLRLKFSLLVSIISFSTLLVIVLAISLGTYFNSVSSLKSDINNVISRINDDKYHPFGMNNYIYCEYTIEPFTVTKSKTSSENKDYESESALKMYYSALSEKNKEYGFYKSFYYKYTSSYFVLVDANMSVDNIKNTIIISSSISISAFILITLLAFIFSKKVVKPYEKLYQKEKRFITDVSHELKTPLAIMEANNEVLELTNKDNEWISSNKKQIDRMNKLVLDMITISKMEELENSLIKSNFDISSLLYETLDLYKSLMIKNNLSLETNIKEEVNIALNQESIHKLFSILLDNAIKYSSSYIKINLIENKKDIILEFINDSKEKLDKEKISHLFDRFYVVDNSRNKKTSGFGIGLSIADLIVKNNGGTIETKLNKDNEISFIIKFYK